MKKYVDLARVFRDCQASDGYSTHTFEEIRTVITFYLLKSAKRWEGKQSNKDDD